MKRIALFTLIIIAGLAAALVYRALAPAGKQQEEGLSQALATGAMARFEFTAMPVTLPALEMRTADGESIGIDRFKGKVVLLNFWATWCAPCLREMPDLDGLQGELGGDDFAVVALSQDRGGVEVVAPFLTEHGFTHLTPYMDPTGAAARALGVTGLPTTLLIDERGREIGRLTGAAEWNTPEARVLIRAALTRP